MIPAIVPAAGASRRMGRPKLTLPLADGSTSINRVLDALLGAGVPQVIVVGPPRNAPGWSVLADRCERPGVSLLIPDAPTADMRQSVTLGLAALGEAPGFLLAPADAPGLTAAHVARVLDRFAADPTRLVIPTHGDRRGHPVAFPDDLIAAIHALPPDAGLNALHRLHPDRVAWLPVDDPTALDDLDTPDDYARWSGQPPLHPPAS